MFDLANITERTGKDGGASFLFRVFLHRDSHGKAVYKSKTWTPDRKMSLAAARKEAKIQAALFEKDVKSGAAGLGGQVKFEEYAAYVVENSQIKKTTQLRYNELLKRINQAIGFLPLEKIQARHLNAFYKDLREGKYMPRTGTAVAKDICKKKITNKCAISKDTGLGQATVKAVEDGRRVALATAEKIAHFFKQPVNTLFYVSIGKETLSDQTILHHHRLIHKILEKARRERLIMFNVAEEVAAPKVRKKEAAYYNEEQIQAFIKCLQEEKDIRIKTALSLLINTGIRRGELCGLRWSAINSTSIQIREQVYYYADSGSMVEDLKTASSYREIPISTQMLSVLNEYRSWWNENTSPKSVEAADGFLFCQGARNVAIYPGTINNWLRRFTENNNLPPITPHGLRHTFATIMISLVGADIKTVQGLTGHSQVSTLLSVYAHSLQTAKGTAVQKMADILDR